MRLSTLLAIPAATAVAFTATLALAGPASAGEVTGTGGPTGALGNANSICMFSGLADGGEGEPAGPGAPPQNWGHVKQELRAAGVPTADIQATRPGVTCNGHTGIFAGGGGE